MVTLQWLAIVSVFMLLPVLQEKTQRQLEYESFISGAGRPAMVLHYLFENMDEAARLLELTPEQVKDLRRIGDRNRRKLIEVVGDLPEARELNLRQLYSSDKFLDLDEDRRNEVFGKLTNIENAIDKEVSDVLVPQQFERLGLGNMHSGLPLVLVRSFIGDMIELTDRQKESIEKAAVKVADEFEQGMTKYRKGMKDRIRAQLSPEQWLDLEGFLGKESLEQYPPDVKPEYLIYGFRQAADMEEASGISKARKQTKFDGDFSSLVQPVLLLNYVLENKKEAADVLELLPYQMEELEAIGDEYRPRAVEIAGEIPAAKELDFRRLCSVEQSRILGFEKNQKVKALRVEVNREVAGVLMEPQIRQLGQTDIEFGLPVILVHSVVGDFIGLTERQKNEIKKEAVNVADEFEALISKYRKKMNDCIRAELTDRQWRELEDIYGKETMSSQPPASIRPKHLIYIYRQVTGGEEK